MRRLIFSASLLVLGMGVLAPAALAGGQVSIPQELSADATIHDVVMHNRNVRNQ